MEDREMGSYRTLPLSSALPGGESSMPSPTHNDGKGDRGGVTSTPGGAR